MQRKFVAACVLAVCGIFVSSCDLIFGNKINDEPHQKLSGSWIAVGDSSVSDSLFNTAIIDSTGKLELIFQADSVLIAEKNDSTILQIKYYQNISADTLYIKRDSSIDSYTLSWSSDSNLMIHDADKSYSFFRE